MLEKNKKLTYSIGQVALHSNLPQSVLRYWETVFPHLSPAKSAGGSRQYSDDDISVIMRIKDLLYENGFTIKGANIQLEKEFANGSPVSQPIEKVIYEKDRKEPISLENPYELIGQLKKIISLLED